MKELKDFYKWFDKQELVLRIILLAIPLVGWIVEILVRGTRMAAKKDTVSIIVFLVVLFVGWAWPLIPIVDIIFLVTEDHLFLADK